MPSTVHRVPHYSLLTIHDSRPCYAASIRHGFLLIAKPAGPTSHDIVTGVRRALGERSIGHLGTLDPLASGLLVLAVGSKALKVVELFQDLPKEYEAEVRLGAVSTTDDALGRIGETPPPLGWAVPEEAKLRTLIADRFLGSIEQVPPDYSAVRIGGERAYRKARRALRRDGATGAGLALAARNVRIDACDVLAFRYPVLRLRVACGSGTYVRSLARDLGKLLGCGGYLRALRRTKVGEWNIGDAVPPERAAWGRVLPLKDVLAGRPKIELTDCEAEDLRHGRDIAREVSLNTIAWVHGLPMAILEPRVGTRLAHPRKVL